MYNSITKSIKTLSIQGLVSILVKLSVFLSLLIISSNIKIYLPFSPVPVTMQNLVLFSAVFFLGRKTYILPLAWISLGVFNLPVFTAGGGLSYFLGYTGGYLIGFLFSGIYLSLVRVPKNLFLLLGYFLIADSIIYLFGGFGLFAFFGFSFSKTIQLGLIPFISGDLFKIALISIIASKFVNQTEK